MPNRYDLLANNPLFIGHISTSTKTGLALGSVYSYAVSGAAVGMKFVAPVSGNLTDLYFFVTATLGTPGVTTVQLRNIIVGTATKPGTTLHAAQTITPGTTANKWIKCTFATPFSVTKGVLYWIVIGDAGWTSGNTVTVDYLGGVAPPITRQFISYTTADGFATAGTPSTTPALVMKFADGTIFGNPFTIFSSYANNTLERGVKIAGLTEDLILSAICHAAPGTNPTGLKIYSGATAPGGTPDATITFGTGGSEGIAEYFPPFTLRKNTLYRVVFTFGGNSTSPGYYEIEDDATSADLLACGFGGGTMYGCIDNGAGGWTDQPDFFPRMALLLQDQVQIARGARPFQGVFA